MERPISATASVNTLHKRAASTKLDNNVNARNNGPTTISLFVKNVRLLNLDLLDDWPVVTPASLGNQDARTRIRNAEWCLYHLFRLYEPATAADKLQPFFPPLEPLQSINLRAALYRCLNEMKKNGCLGRETVLRKSMLDDCQGDKFWELCLGFSTVVLRRTAVDQQNGYGKPLAERLGTAASLSKSQRDSMLPLSIAHRAALSKVLVEKDRKRQAFDRLSKLYTGKEADLRTRKAKAQQWLKSGQAASQSEKGMLAQEVLDKQWVGSAELRDALVKGEPLGSGDGVLTRPFPEVWETCGDDPSTEHDTSDDGILADLEHRAIQQRQRLQRWQTFHDDLIHSKPMPARASSIQTQDTEVSFDRHQTLTVGDFAENSSHSTARSEQTALISKYDEILTSMREELRKRSQSVTRQTSAPEPIVLPKRPPMRVTSGSYDSAAPVPQRKHSRQPSQTAVPFRPALGRRVSSRSKSYQQPKVINQREPIPLKSEIFSPLKTQGRNGPSPITGSVVASPIEQNSAEGTVDDLIATASERSRPNSDGLLHNGDAGLGIRTSSRMSNQSTSSSSPRNAKSSADHPDSAVDVSSRPNSLALKNVDSLGRPVRPSSLVERTRLSMAFRSSEDTIDAPSESETQVPRGASPSEGDDADPSALPGDDPPLDRRATLLERTRQSISLAPQHPTPAQSAAQMRARTAAYPVNQFTTPQKQTSGSTAADEPRASEATGRRDFTPREKLFEEDAEYASVFKTRPKIALSPIMSPYADSSVADLNLDEVDTSSPLVGVGGRG